MIMMDASPPTHWRITPPTPTVIGIRVVDGMRNPLMEEIECTHEITPKTSAVSIPSICPLRDKTTLVSIGSHNARFQRLKTSVCLIAADISEVPANPEDTFSEASLNEEQTHAPKIELRAR